MSKPVSASLGCCTPYMQRPFVLMTRAKVFVNTDPQRRCYNGAYASHEYAWAPWVVLDRCASQEAADRRLKFWRELNDYAVSQRGEGSRKEFKIVPKEEAENVRDEA